MSRPRASSRTEAIGDILQALPEPHEPTASSSTTAASKPASSTRRSLKRQRKVDRENSWWLGDAGEVPTSAGLWQDIRSGRWMIIPSSSGAIVATSLLLFVNYAALQQLAPELVPYDNPFECLWKISYELPAPYSSPDDLRYGKGLKDIAFLLNHIITFSFIRQAMTLWVLRPLAMRLGIKGAKILRFQEQSYSFLYWGFFGFLGLHLMQDLPTWYFKTEEFWLGYPHWNMKASIKLYYLLQFSYWLQQMIIVVLKIEKPRKDYFELVIHHIVTLWLIGWSYGTNLTMIGNAVFVTMDISDTFLALAKSINYSEGPNSSGLGSAVAFGFFVLVWTYLRHYLNFWILWSVWDEFKLIPEHAKVWAPEKGVWLAPWMRYQIFIPIMLIQLLNLFWYWSILRILIRAIRGVTLADDRSDDEDEGEEEEVEDKKTR